MRLLEAAGNEGCVSNRVNDLGWNEWLGFLGPQGWESLCLGYLIFEHEFVPTGLVTGGTLNHHASMTFPILC